ncbi:LOW QUALITY PROTEIN: neuroblast differentiation-associated protein AHNAK [Brachyistius frenatus]|uniref:LOW QUALITY PROTEIN: neuroblast differentiation-associated protein AHNAK n=1 Tax=Brachyistius frenatus TaxID=100188 RepID=UPI0037E964B3
MAEEEDTREVLFPDWEGPDKTGLTIAQSSEGELFVTEVKGESPAARSGQVYEGDQIVGATIYFDKMSSEETADLLKTLNRHKVGLKLQNKGDRSPSCSPLSTPCRSPMGTLTWEGKTRFGGSSPDIILSGDDEDYKRIYTKKIKPRLKSEDLAEGVDVRTERHSSTSSDGSTITTVTRRITTYTVDMPSDISEQLELSSPDLKGLRHESGDGSPRIRISHGSPSGKVGAEEGVFESGNVTYTGPQASSTETRWGSGGVQTTQIVRDEKERSKDIRFKGLNFGVTGGKGQEGIEISRGSGEQDDGSIQVSGTSMTLKDGTNTGSRHVTIGGLGGADIASTGENGGSVGLSLPGKSMQISTTTMDKTQVGSFESSSGGRTKVKLSEIAINDPQTKASGRIDIPHVKVSGGSTDIDSDLRGGRIGESTSILGHVTTGYSSTPGKISVTGMDVNLTGSKLKGDVNLPSTKGGIKVSGIDTKVPGCETEGNASGITMSTIKMPAFGTKGIMKEGTSSELSSDADMSVYVTHEDVHKSKLGIKGTDMQIKGQPYANIEGPVVSVRRPEAEIDIKEPEIHSSLQMKVPKSDGKYKMEVKVPSLSGPDTDVNLKGSKIEENLNVTVSKTEGEIIAPKVNIKHQNINIEGMKGDYKLPHVKMPSFGAKGPNVDIKADAGNEAEGRALDLKLTTPEIDTSASRVDIDAPEVDYGGSDLKIKGPKFMMTSKTVNVKTPQVDVGTSRVKVEIPDVTNLPKGQINAKPPGFDVKAPGADVGSTEGGAPQMPDVDFKLEGPDVDNEHHKIGFKMPKITMPSFGITSPKLERPEADVRPPKADVHVKAAEVNIKGQNVDIENPNGNIKGSKFKVPTLTGPNISMPDLDLSVKGPTFKGEGGVSPTKMGADIKTPEIDIQRPQADIIIEGQKGGFQKPSIKMPSMNLKGSKGNVDLKLKGPTVKGDVDPSLPKIKGDAQTPEVNVEGPEVEIEGYESGFKMPKFKIPSFGFKDQKGDVPDVDVNLPRANINVRAPDIDIERPEVNIEGPNAKLQGPKFNMPTISGPKISMPNVDFNLKGPKVKGGVDLSAPKIKGDLSTPEVDIKGPEVDIEGPKGGFDMPKIKMPSFGIKGPKVEGPDVDVNLPKASIDVKAPEIDVEGLDANLKGSKFKMPSISAPKLPDWDINLKGPKVKGDFDVSVPKIEGDLKAPKVDIEGPDVDIEGHKGGFKMPKFKIPSFGLKGPNVEGPEVDVSLPKADIDVKGPEVDISGPDVDIECPSGKIKGPKFNMPSISGPKISMPDVDFNLKGPKVKGGVDVSAPKIKGDASTPEVDIEYPEVDIQGSKGRFDMPKIKMPSFGIKGPKVEGPDVDVNLPKASIDIKAPEIDVEGPDANLKGPKFKMPSISAPKLPDWDINLKGPKVKGDFDVSVPKIEGDLKAPKVDIEGPDVDIEGHKGGFKMPKFKIPSFGLKGPNVEGPEVDVSLPKADIDVKGPEVDISGPDVDIECPSGKIKGSKFNMPSISGPKISMPNVDFNLKGPKVKGGVDVSAPKIKGDLSTPEVDIKGPEVDIQGPKGGFDMPKIKMPSFGIKGPKVEGPDVDVNLPKASIDVKAPEIDVEGPDANLKGSKFKMPSISAPKLPDWDINLKGPKVKGDFDVSVPKIEGDLKAPKVDIEGPDVDIEGHKGGFKMPKFKIPSFGLKGPNVEGPEFDVSLPKADIDVKGPEVDIEGPDVDIECPSGKIKGPKFNMPSISGPKISMPDVDFNLKGPKVKGGVDLSAPKIKGDLSTPEVDIKGPEVDIEGPKGGFDMPKIKMPSFGIKGPKMEGPDVDIDVKVPEVEMKGPGIDVECPDAKLRGPKFKLPSISGPNLPDWDVSLKGPKMKGDVDVSVPKIEGDIKSPKVDIEGPDVDIEGHKGGFKMPKFKMPSFGMKGPHIEGPEVDVNLPKADIDIKAPELDIEGPDIDIDSPSGKIRGPKFNMPSMSGPKISMPDVDFNLKGPKTQRWCRLVSSKDRGRNQNAEVDIKGPKGGFDMPKMKMPSFGIKGPKVEGPDVGVNLPKANIDIKAPDVDIQGPEVDFEGPDAKLKGPKIKFPSLPGPKLPDWDINLKGPKIQGDFDVSAPKIEGDIEAPKVDIELPDVDIEGHKGGFKMPKFNMPSFGLKGPNVEGPEVDVALSKGDVNINAPDLHIKGTDVEIESPSGKIKGPRFQMPSISGPKMSMPDLDFNMKGPKIKGDVDMSAPKIEAGLKTPEVDIEGPKGGFEMPKIKMPSLNIKGSKVQGPGSDIDLKTSDLDINLKGPKVKGEMDASVSKLEGPSITFDSEKTGVTFPKFKGPKFAMKSPEAEGKVSLPDTEASLDAPDVDINVKGKKGKFKLPKVKGKAKKPDLDKEMPSVDVDLDTPNIHAKGTKVKKPLFGKLHFPNVEFDIKSPKVKGDGSLSEGFKSSDIHLPSASLNTAVGGSGADSANVSLEGLDFKAKTSKISSSVSGGSEIGGLQYPQGSVTFPKVKVPKFGIVLPRVEGQEDGGKVDSKLAACGGINIQPPSVNIEVPSPELGHTEGKVKVKMPKFFGKSKAKDRSAGDLRGSEVELSSSGKIGKTSKELSAHSGELMGGTFELEGDSGLGVSTKSKSASLDLLKKSRHRSSSLSDEGELAVSSPSVEAEGGDISLDLGGSKAKGKKGKLKFGTFGGFGSKSKGSYEVTLGDDGETGVEGSAGVLHSKKSRLSSSSSNDSGSRGGFRFPKLELTVSPKK